MGKLLGAITEAEPLDVLRIDTRRALRTAASEISPTVGVGPRAVILDQADNGRVIGNIGRSAAKVFMVESKSVTRVSGPSANSTRRETGPRTEREPRESRDSPVSYRHELKYHVTEAQAVAIAEFVSPFVQLDRYCKLQTSRDYPIVSLYLDSGDLRLCRESVTGQKNRFKLRIRSYTDDPDYPRFFEVKRRVNTITAKSRAPVMDCDVETLLSGRPLPPHEHNADVDTISQFQLYVSNIGAAPVVLVRYMREAYEGNDQNRVRVTFDRELAYKTTRSAQVRLGDGGWQRNPFTIGGVILEIKFTDRYPAWLGRMVRHFDLQARSVSKYASSIQDSGSLRFCAPEMPTW